MDVSGTSDPYVKLHLLPGASKVSNVHCEMVRIGEDLLRLLLFHYFNLTE